jgi:hypothetical protein
MKSGSCRLMAEPSAPPHHPWRAPGKADLIGEFQRLVAPIGDADMSEVGAGSGIIG